MSGLEITLIYLLAAVLGVVLCRSLKLPPMLGYLAVGVVIGPNALALSQDAGGVRHLGEFGVVFLMFVIGLEFNLPKLSAMRRHVFGLGLLQVVVTMLGATLVTLALAAWLPTMWSMSWQSALALACALGRWFLPGGIYSNWRMTALIWLALAGCLAHARYDFPFQIYSILLLFLLLCAILSVVTHRRPSLPTASR